MRGQRLGGAVEQAAVGAFQRVGRQCRHQRVRLDQHGEAGQRALGLRRGGEAAASAVQTASLTSGVTRDAFGGEQRRHPLQGEGDLAGLVDPRQRLQRQRAFEPELDALARPWPAPRPAAERPRRTGSTCAPMKRRNCRASSASSTDLPAPVGPTHQGVADIADMQVEPERCAAARLRHHQRRRR